MKTKINKFADIMPKALEISNDLRVRIIEDNKNGLSYRKIADKYKISFSGVRHIIKKFEATGLVKNMARSGRKRKTTAREDVRIVRMVKQQPTISSREIGENLNLDVSGLTIRRRIKESGLRSCIQRKKPYISKANTKKRLQFAREHINKDETFWNSIIWSDESKFELFGTKKRKRVWRRSGEALKQSNLQQTVKHCGGSVIVWGCFAACGVGKIKLITETMTGKVYIDILDECLKKSVLKLGISRRYIFQQDNDPKHTCKLAQEYFKKKKIKILEWPPQSPDLNPIENLWSYLDGELPFEQRKNKTEFFNLIRRKWEEISADITQNLILSMNRRLEAVIKAKGGPTKY